MTDKQVILHYLEERIEIIRKKIEKKSEGDVQAHMCYQASLSELSNARKRIKCDFMFARLQNRARYSEPSKENSQMKEKKEKSGAKYVELKRFNDLNSFQEIVSEKGSRRKRNWLNLIKVGRLTCPVTNLEVAYFSYEKCIGKNGRDSFHYNFYSACGKLFTIDHIMPVSKGGLKSCIDNIQPMEAEANFEKSDKWEE